jgi:LCP family protein required for cell wall assembly
MDKTHVQYTPLFSYNTDYMFRSPRNLISISIIGLALGLILIGGLRITLGVQRNVAALSVTAAPLPSAARPAPTPLHAADAPIVALPAVPAMVSVPTPRALPTPRDPAYAPITILLLGSDQRPNSTAIPRTDAIMLVHVDRARERVALLSLPRDLWAPIPGYGLNRINNAYLYGERAGPPGAGMSLARATLSDLLQVPIDYVALIDFTGFAALIDAIGGIVVDVPAELIDTRFPTADYRTTTVRFAAGPQQMSGAAALTYSRIRNPDLDFGRIARQQQVILAIAEQLRSRGYLTNMLAAEDLTGAFVGYVQTDMPPERIAELAFALRNYAASNVERYQLQEADVRYGIAADRFALQVAPERLAALVAQWHGE